MTTSRDAARLAGVSQSTVSRVVRGSDKVSAATRERVRAAIEASGYRPHAAAAAMRTQRTGTIGVVVTSVTNPFYPALLDALSHELERLDLRMILWNAASGAGEQAALDAIDERRVDGIVFTTATADSVALNRAVERGSPVVQVNRVVRGVACDTVDTNNEVAGEELAGYFAAGGHERVGIVSGPQIANTNRDRVRGFRRGVREHGLRLAEEHLVSGEFSHERGARALDRILDAPGPPPTAVFAVNDISALGVLDAARARGIAVPDDLWVAGYDDIEMASWEAYQLTTVRQPVPDMARAAVDLLVERIGTPSKTPESRCFPAEIVVRRSTAHHPLPGAGRPGEQEGKPWST